MKLFLVTAAVFLLAILGMAVGVILSNRRLRGSCGGLAGREDAQGPTACDLCTAPSKEYAGEGEKVVSRESGERGV